jgi:hypothetical protein
MLKLGLAVSAMLALCIQDEVDNAEYKNWSSCGVGSWVTMKMETEAAGNKTEMEQTHKLVEKTDAKCVVETSGKMVVAGNTMDLPANKRDIPAKIKKGDAKEGEKPKEGDEEIEVGGKKVKCHWVESTSENAGTKTTAKVWTCDDIPGKVAKIVSKSEGAAASSMTMVASGWEKK